MGYYMVDEKFQMKTYEDHISVIDTETGRELHLNDKWHVKQLIGLLNDWRNIIKDKWGVK